MKKVEIDELETFVGNKENIRWLWSILDHYAGKLLAYVCGRRTTKTFKKLMALVDDLNISLHYTDKLNIYKAFVSVDEHAVSKFKMQRIERLHLTYRTRIKWLNRKTDLFF